MPVTVSVVIPVYNRSVAVRRAIDSVVAQTFQDFEIIVVDDASTDGTAASVESYTDSRLRFIRHDRNRGGSAARNSGIRAATAAFVAFLDSDDEWLPTKLEKQLALFDRSSNDVALVYTGAERVHADGKVEISIPKRYDDMVRELLTDNVVGETSVGMVRRSALEDIGGFDEVLPASQDMDLWLRLCERFAADFVPEALVRVSKGNDSGRITASIESTTRGSELFRLKHRDQLVRKGGLYLHLRKSGWWYQRGARNAKQARRCYRESLAANPAAPLTYVLLIAACMPLSWLDRLAGLKRSLVGLLHSGSHA